MSASEIVKYMKSALIRGEIFILPGIGEFKPAHQPADIDEAKGKITPPQHTIEFNPEKTEDSGKLAAYIAQKADIKTEDAQKQIREFAAELKRKISEKGIYYIEGLGQFELSENTYKFQQDDKEVLAGDSYGMNAVRFMDTPREQSESRSREQTAPSQSKESKGQPQPASGKSGQTANSKQTHKTKQTKTASKSTRKNAKSKKKPAQKSKGWVMPLVLSLIILVVVLGGGYTLIRTGVIGSSNTNEAGWIANVRDFRFFGSAEKAGPGQTTTKSSNQAEAGKDDPKPADDKPAQEKPESPASPESEKGSAQEQTGAGGEQQPGKDAYQEPERQSSTEDRFYLIAGSFAKFENAYDKAEAYVEQGFDAEVLESEEGRFRVAIASFSSRSEAMAELERLKEEENISSWVLQR